VTTRVGKIYTLSFYDYDDAKRALRKLKKRGVRLISLVAIVEVDHWNKVKDMLNNDGLSVNLDVAILVLRGKNHFLRST